MKNDYRQILRDRFEERCRKTPHYSLRAFSRALNIAPARLSDILNGRYGLSRRAASLIARRLGMSVTEQEYFCDLVESKHSRTQIKRKAAQLRLLKYSENQEIKLLNLDLFRVVSDWYYFAILELTCTNEFQSDPDWIASQLNISKVVVRQAIDRLIRVGLLEHKEGQYRVLEESTFVGGDIPSHAIKNFHSQWLEKAGKALFQQTLEEREFNSVVLSIDSSQLLLAKTLIRKFRREFSATLKNGPKKDKVYCLMVNFFDMKTG